MASAARLIAGKYQTLRRLAVGGMGEIFLVRERGRRGFSRLVVIKRMLPQLARERGIVEMFVDEARIVGQLSHPNICQILELGEESGVPFLVLEYVQGESLAAMWDRAMELGVPVPRTVTLRLLADTATALHFAHEARDAEGQPLHVVHRDVSPHNVMVTFHGDVKIMDFGIARANNRQHRTDTGTIKGKLSYMSPEQLHGLDVDRRGDVFALGVIAWELTLGQRLFGGSSEPETLQKVMACEIPRPSSVDPSYPPALEAVVMRALSREREARTPTAGELARGLLEQLAAEGGAERGDVAAVLRRLFPAELTAETDAGVAVDPGPWRAPEASLARPTLPLRAEQPPSDAITEPGENSSSWRFAENVARRRTGGRGAWVVAVLGAVALAGAVGWRALDRTDAQSSPVLPTAAVPPSPPPVVATPPPEVTPTATEVAPTEAREHPHPAPPKNHRRTSSTSQVAPPPPRNDRGDPGDIIHIPHDEFTKPQ